MFFIGMSKTKNEMETMVHQNRIVWEETMRYADQHGRVPAAEQIKTIPPMELGQKSRNTRDRVIKVFNNSILDVAAAATRLGLKPLVVNAGSDNDPLKPLSVGAIGTEWDLFRRSNLHASLNHVDLYPLRDGAVLYAPQVTVFRTENFKLMRNPYQVSIVTIPPVRRPGLVSNRVGDTTVDRYQNSTEESRMRTAIEKIFQVALLKGHRCIVVDDFGCNKNCENPIDTVLDMFNDAIKKYPVKYVFSL